jgi:uncharacterized protein
MDVDSHEAVMAGKGAMSGCTIELWSGHFMDLTNVKVSDIRREDIAVGLSNCCRYAGQCRRFYSVAEHSVLVSDLIPFIVHRFQSEGSESGVQLAGLLHDAPEAYVGDMTAPLKALMRKRDMTNTQWAVPSMYDRIEAHIMLAVNVKFDLLDDRVTGRIVKLADLWAFRIESSALMASNGGGSGYNVPPEVEALGGLPNGVMWYAGLDPIDARDLFRDRWQQLDVVDV